MSHVSSEPTARNISTRSVLTEKEGVLLQLLNNVLTKLDDAFDSGYADGAVKVARAADDLEEIIKRYISGELRGF